MKFLIQVLLTVFFIDILFRTEVDGVNCFQCMVSVGDNVREGDDCIEPKHGVTTGVGPCKYCFVNVFKNDDELSFTVIRGCHGGQPIAELVPECKLDEFSSCECNSDFCNIVPVERPSWVIDCYVCEEETKATRNGNSHRLTTNKFEWSGDTHCFHAKENVKKVQGCGRCFYETSNYHAVANDADEVNGKIFDVMTIKRGCHKPREPYPTSFFHYYEDRNDEYLQRPDIDYIRGGLAKSDCKDLNLCNNAVFLPQYYFPCIYSPDPNCYADYGDFTEGQINGTIKKNLRISYSVQETNNAIQKIESFYGRKLNYLFMMAIPIGIYFSILHAANFIGS